MAVGWAGLKAGIPVRMSAAARCGIRKFRAIRRCKGNSMTVAASAQVHPTAIISTEATISEGVRIGPYAVIDGPVTVGPECEIGPHVHLVGPLLIGRGNRIGTASVIG